MDFFWGINGHSLFDPYSLQHIVWFFAITVALAACGARRVWIWGAFVALGWEIFEWLVAGTSFPFAGKEEFWNKVVGDTISDAVGLLLAAWAVRAIRRKEECRIFRNYE
jgi:hypothetical protein